jgi:transglutaminase-like putative cysteine protease
LLASLCCVLLSMALFPLLPRVRSGALFDRGFGPSTAMSGFSERVELGDLGRIRLDPTRVLRVTTLEGSVAAASERYWRGLAFDHFDGRRWSVTPKQRASVAGDPEIGVDLGGPRRRGRRVVQQLAREPLESGVLFTPGLPAAFRGAVGRLQRDSNRALHASATRGKRVLYHVVADLAQPTQKALTEDRVATGGVAERLLQLPTLDPRVATLAEELTVEHSNDAARVRAVEAWLRTRGRYTDTPPDFGSDGSPLEGFLLERAEGHCEYFASGMVVLLRSVGIPARLVNGFAGGHANSLGGFVELAQSDAHTWVEVPFKKAGFVRYDPTPPDLRLASADALREGAGLSELASAVELWWFRNIVDFDRGHQARAVRSAWLAWHRWRKKPGAEEPKPADDSWALVLPTAPLWGLLVVVGFGAAAAADLRRRRRRTRPQLPPEYGRALRLLARRGHVRGESEAARDFAHRLEDRLPAEGVRAFEALTESYLAERFGGAPRQQDLSAWRTLRHHLRS